MRHAVAAKLTASFRAPHLAGFQHRRRRTWQRSLCRRYKCTAPPPRLLESGAAVMSRPQSRAPRGRREAHSLFPCAAFGRLPAPTSPHLAALSLLALQVHGTTAAPSRNWCGRDVAPAIACGTRSPRLSRLPLTTCAPHPAGYQCSQCCSVHQHPHQSQWTNCAQSLALAY